MYSLVITIVAVVCAVEYLNQKAMNYALLKWIDDRFSKQPGAEIESDLVWAWKHMLGIN